MTDNSGTLPPPPFQPPSGQPEQPPSEDGKRRTWWIIGGGAALLVVALIIAGSLASDDDDSSATESTPVPQTTQAPPTTVEVVDTTAASETTDTVVSTTDSPATTEAAVETTQSPETTAAPIAEPRCGYVGVDDFDDMQVEVEFVNPLGSVPAVEVAFALLDGSGTRFHTDAESFDLPRVDERFRFEADTFTGLPPDIDGAAVTCQILDISEGFGYDDVRPPSESSSGDVAEIDGFGDIQVDLATTSPFESTETLEIYYALRGGDARFADSYASVEFVASGESVRVAEDTVTDVPAWTSEQELSCEVLGVRASGF